MTEKLTYDPTPADAPEFNEQEQAALEVADKLGQEENELLAGKYRNAEELENAYLELQKKLGSDDDDAEVDTESDEPEEEVSAGVSLITDASKEYFENDGKLSPDTMSKFSEMSAQDLVQAYMDVQKNNPIEPGAQDTSDLTDAEINSIYNSAGGEAEYGRLTSWASQNLAEDKMNAFNSVVNNGEALAIQMAVAGLRSEYENQEGYEGRMLTGKAAKTQDGFRSQAEVVQAMSDPRYDRDPAYRQDLYDKLERSNVAF
jgi:hypothetical protein